jgi:hypothetical protein
LASDYPSAVQRLLDQSNYERMARFSSQTPPLERQLYQRKLSASLPDDPEGLVLGGMDGSRPIVHLTGKMLKQLTALNG